MEQSRSLITQKGEYLLQVVLGCAGGLVCPVRLVGDGGAVGLQGSLLVITIERLHHGLLTDSRVRGHRDRQTDSPGGQTDRPGGQTDLGTDCQVCLWCEEIHFSTQSCFLFKGMVIKIYCKSHRPQLVIHRFISSSPTLTLHLWITAPDMKPSSDILVLILTLTPHKASLTNIPFSPSSHHCFPHQQFSQVTKLHHELFTTYTCFSGSTIRRSFGAA